MQLICQKANYMEKTRYVALMKKGKFVAVLNEA
jgi:hypothetical protein